MQETATAVTDLTVTVYVNRFTHSWWWKVCDSEGRMLADESTAMRSSLGRWVARRAARKWCQRWADAGNRFPSETWRFTREPME